MCWASCDRCPALNPPVLATVCQSLAVRVAEPASTALEHPYRPSPGDLPSATIRVVTSGYFKTLRIPILRGREFDSTDEAPEAAPGFIVNDAFVRQYLREVDPLSTSISVRMQRENPYRQIIGVVGDVPEGSIRGRSGQPFSTASSKCRSR